MTAGERGYVLRRGMMFHAFRSGTMTAAPEQARVWADRGAAVEQANALNLKPYSSMPPWEVQPAVPEGSVQR